MKAAGGRVETGDALGCYARPRLQRQLAGLSLCDAHVLARPGSSSSCPHEKHTGPCFPRFCLSRSSHSDSSRFISAWRPPSDPTVPSRDSVPLLPGSHPNPAHQTARLFLCLFCAPAICPPSPAWFGSPSALLVEVLGVAAPCPATQGFPVLQRCLFPLPVWLMAPQRAGSVAGQPGFESSSPAL